MGIPAYDWRNLWGTKLFLERFRELIGKISGLTIVMPFPLKGVECTSKKLAWKKWNPPKIRWFPSKKINFWKDFEGRSPYWHQNDNAINCTLTYPPNMNQWIKANPFGSRTMVCCCPALLQRPCSMISSSTGFHCQVSCSVHGRKGRFVLYRHTKRTSPTKTKQTSKLSTPI